MTNFFNIKSVSKKFSIVRFEVFTAVTMKNAVFWDVAPCRSCVIYMAPHPRRRHSSSFQLIVYVFLLKPPYSQIVVFNCQETVGS
jgi:hypothetical protein